MPEAIPVGAHLVSPRRGYMHHGIYAGDGRVIHYAGFSRGYHRGPVEEVDLQQFTRGRELRVQTRVARRFDGRAAVERARRRLGEDRYRFWSNNCEHFVEWCISGASRSPQVETWLGLVSRAWQAVGQPLANLARVQALRLQSRQRGAASAP